MSSNMPVWLSKMHELLAEHRPVICLSLPSLLTYCCIVEDNQKTGIVNPFDFKPSPLIFVFSESRLDVPCLEFGRKAME